MDQMPGQQSKLESAIEQICNVGSGMIIAYAVMELILAPVLGIGITPMQNIWTTIVLTIVSVIRGYFWRRFFNKRLYKDLAVWIKSKTSKKCMRIATEKGFYGKRGRTS